MGRRNLSDGTTFEVVGFYGPGDDRARVLLFAPWDAVPEEWREFDRCGDREAWTEVTIDPRGHVYSYGGAVWPAAFPAHFGAVQPTTQDHSTTARAELLAAVFGPDPGSDDLRCAYCGRRWPCPEAGGSHTSLGELRARNRVRAVAPEATRGLTMEAPRHRRAGRGRARAARGGQAMKRFTITCEVEALAICEVEAETIEEARAQFERGEFTFSHYAEECVGALRRIEEDD